MSAVVIPDRVLDRIWDRIDVGDPADCWPWKLSLSPQGYGQVGWWADGKNHMTTAHRAAWTAENGPIPAGLFVDHLCRNRQCCNPSHMELVTNVTNILRGEGASAQNARKSHCPSGHPYDESNTYISPKGDRRCRTCKQQKAVA